MSRTERQSQEALAEPYGVAARRVVLDATHDFIAPVLVETRRLDPVGEQYHLMAASSSSFGLRGYEEASAETTPPKVPTDPEALQLASPTPCASVTGADELALPACLDPEVAVFAESGPCQGLFADERLDECQVLRLGPCHHPDSGLHRPLSGVDHLLQ
jgi:hypothetical protein